MALMRTIEIDLGVHQKIEQERTSFEEEANDVLRRLLNLKSVSLNPAPVSPGTETNGRAWSGKGVSLPHGTEVRMEYNGRVYSGRIDDGAWLVEGHRSKSPSDAAGSSAKTKAGKRPVLNGWNYWKIKRPGDAFWWSLNGQRPG